VLAAVVVAAVLAPGPAGGGARPAAVSWSGGFTLPLSAQPVALTVLESGASAVVSLGPGHATGVQTSLARSSGRFGFSLPGRPWPLVFSGTATASTVTGSVRQGATAGRFRLARVARPPLDSVLGLYRLASGHVLGLVDYRRLGLPVWAVDYSTGSFRALSGTPGVLRAGPTVLRTAPTVARGTVANGRLTWQGARATRLPVRQYEIRFPSAGVTLAGTLTVPATPGRHPAVAVVHGSGPSLRDEGQFTAGLFLTHGIAVLSYDKRGNGQSGGIYPGGFASAQAIEAYAADADAAIRFLGRQPDLDPHRLGLFGGSQGGWIVPLAAFHSPLVRFAVLESGPVVSVGESDSFAAYTSQGAAPLARPLAQIEAQVEHDGPSGFDPRPFIRRLTIPMLWLYGGVDMNQPSHLDVKDLEQLKAATGHDYEWHLYPDGNHGLFELKTGLNSDLASSRGLPAAFFADVASWLREHGLAR